MCVVAQSCLTLWDPMDCSPLDFSVHRIFQARILEWVTTILLQGIFPTQESNPHLVCLLHCTQILYPLSCQGSPKMRFVVVVVLAAKSCPTLFDLRDCSPPGSSVHGFFRQEHWSGCRALLQGIFSAQGSNVCFLHWQEDSLSLSHQGSP